MMLKNYNGTGKSGQQFPLGRSVDYATRLDNFVKESCLPPLSRENKKTLPVEEAGHLIESAAEQTIALGDLANQPIIGVDLEFHQQYSFDGELPK